LHHPPPHRPPAVRRPRAAAHVVVQFGDVLNIGGNLYTVTPTLTPAGSGPVPPPTPPPTPPPIPAPPPVAGHVTGFQAGTPPALLPAAGVTPGMLLTITGTGFGTPAAGAFGRVIIGGTEAAVKTWTDVQVTAIVPNAAPNPPAALLTVKLYWQASLSASPQLVANDGPLLLVQPGPAPAAGAKPTVFGYRGNTARPPAGPDFALQPLTTATLDGRALGSMPGRLTWGTTALPLLGWDDQAIRFTVPAAPLGVLQPVTVTRADGQAQGFRGFTVLP
jgi:hypothetical protein